jgi:hypothetical protein
MSSNSDSLGDRNRNAHPDSPEGDSDRNAYSDSANEGANGNASAGSANAGANGNASSGSSNTDANQTANSGSSDTDARRPGSGLGSATLSGMIGALALDQAAGVIPTDVVGLTGMQQAADGVLCTDCIGADDGLDPNGAAIGTLTAVENNVVDDFHALLESIGHEAGEPANGIVHSLTTFGEAVGFGNAGGPTDDLVSSVLAAPSAVVDGQAVAAVCNIVDQAENAISAGGTFVNKVVDAANLSDPLSKDVIGKSADLINAVTGNGGSIADNVNGIVNKVGLITDDVATLVDQVAGAENTGGLTGNIGTIIDGLDHIAGNLGSAPLLDANLLDLGGDDSGGLITALVNSGLSQPGALIDIGLVGNDSSSQSNNLIDVNAGPQSIAGQNTDGLATLAVLSTETGGNGAIQVNAIEVGSNGPELLDADLLNDDDALAALLDSNIDPLTDVEALCGLPALAAHLPQALPHHELLV